MNAGNNIAFRRNYRVWSVQNLASSTRLCTPVRPVGRAAMRLTRFSFRERVLEIINVKKNKKRLTRGTLTSFFFLTRPSVFS